MNKTIETLHKIKKTIHANISKNAIVLGILLYLIIYTIWNLLTFLLSGDISIAIFYGMLITNINIPFVIMLSIVLTGRWKGAIQDNMMEKKLATVDKMLCLKKQEMDYEVKLKIQQIEHLKLEIQQFHTIEDLRQELSYSNEIWSYKCVIAARDGCVSDAIISNKNWNDSNEALGLLDKKEIDQLKKTVQETVAKKLEENGIK